MSNSGLSENTLERLLRNLEGTLTVNNVAMGGYEDGDVVLTPAFEYDDPNFAGTLGPLAGSEFIIRATGTLSVNMKEAHYAALQVYLGDLGAINSGASEQIGGAELGLRNYVENVVFDGIIRGQEEDITNVKIVISNAAVNPPPLTFSSKRSAVFPIVFDARYDIATPRTYPITIYLEKPA